MSKWSWLGMLLLTGILYVATAQLNWRLDLTADQRYTVSEPVKKLLNNLQEPIQITVLLKGENMPAGFKKLATATANLLSSYRDYSNGQLSYRFLDEEAFLADSFATPLADSIKIQWLQSNAVKQNEVTQSGTKASFVYPLALVKAGDYFAQVNLLQGQGNTGFMNPDAQTLQQEMINKAEAQMEYQVAAAIQDLTRTRLPRVAYVTGEGEPTGPETYDLSQTLQSKYEFYLLNLEQQVSISDSLDAVIIVKPTLAFSDEAKLKLDQYLMRGGHLLFLIDALNADMDSLVQSGTEFTAYARETNLEDLLFRYGARINNNLVQDRQSDILPQNVGSLGGEPQIEMLPWPYFPLLYSNSNHPIVKNLDAVVMQFPNSVDTVKVEGVHKEILLTSSNTTRLVGTPVIITVEILKQLDNASAFPDEQVPLAVLLEGNFKSLYANRMAGSLEATQQLSGQPFHAASVLPGKVLVTGDGDWVLNGMGRNGPLAMGTNPYTQYQFANRDFLLNTLDYMTDESGIMEARSRDFVLRLLDAKKLEKEAAIWRWLNIGGPLVLMLLTAFVVFIWRKKRFASL